MIQAPERRATQARRKVGALLHRFASGGRPAVTEQWMRYPAEPLEPSYYAQLLASAAGMSEEEQRARAMMEPRETPRARPPANGQEHGFLEV